MKTKSKIVLFVVLPILLVAIVGVIIFMLPRTDHTHEFSDWATTEEATCEKSGIKQRTCSCGETETESIAQLVHSFSVPTETKEGSTYVVQMLCPNCKKASDFSAQGMFLDDDNSMYLTDCPQNFAFDVTSAKDIDYIKENVLVCESIYRNVDKNKNPEVLEEISVVHVSENTYRVTCASSYLQNEHYFVSLPEDVSFSCFPGEKMDFTIAGDEVCEIEYQENILFLKKLEQENPGYYPYEMSFYEEESVYVLSLSQAGILTRDYIGRLICVGDCADFMEAAVNPTDVVIGKITDIVTDGSSVKLLLTAPSLDEVYSKLKVSGGSGSLNEANFLSAEYKEYLTAQLLSSDAFATSLTSVSIAADNIAQTYNLRAVKQDFDFNNLNFTINVEDVTSDDSPTYQIDVTVEYKHSIPFEKNGKNYGSVDFNIKFSVTSKFKIHIYTNIEKFGKLKNNEKIMKFDCTLTNNNYIAFDLSAKLNLEYASETASAIYYVQNPNSQKIHRSDCRMAAKLKETSEHYDYEDAVKLPDYLDYECSWCKPFTMSETTFVLNSRTNVLHCGDCEHIEDIDSKNMIVYSVCPIGRKVKNCTDCKPETHTKSVETYIKESLSDGNWDVVFASVQQTLGDKLKGIGGSKITSKSVPRNTFTFLCFEIPIYVEPQFNFDLKANFSFHFDAMREDVYMLTLVHDGKSYSLQSSHDTVDPNGEEDDSHLTLDVQGQLRTELGVLVEVRFGFLYTSKWAYFGLDCESGLYVESAGVLHIDSAKEDYYAARIEAGIYLEAACRYAVPLILPEGGQPILEKKSWPFFESGDVKAYQSFLSDDPVVKVNKKSTALNESLLLTSYFDLKDMIMKEETLNWSGTDAYGLTFRFADEKGNAVTYCSVEDGVLKISDDAPEAFEITMYIGVVDKVLFDNPIDYLFTKQSDGAAFFMDELSVTVKYPAEDIIERDVVLVLDASGSMQGTPMTETKNAATRFIDTVLPQNSAVGIVTYDSTAQAVSDFSTNAASLKNAVNAVNAGGGTNIESGLILASLLLEESQAEKKIIVLMSDGEPNDGKVGDELIAYADELKEEGIYIYTLGFFGNIINKSAAQSLMEGIASDGCHYEVDTAENLIYFFSDVAEQIQGTKYIYVRIACPVDVTVRYNGEKLTSKNSETSQRTSFGTLTFEENEKEVENSTDNRIKILRLKEGADYDVKIEGNGTGRMTYTIGFMDESGEYTDMRKFSNVKITKKTEIDTVATLSDVSVMNVDEDGDGDYDYFYEAEQNSRAQRVEKSYWYVYVLVAVGVIALATGGFFLVRKISAAKAGKEPKDPSDSKNAKPAPERRSTATFCQHCGKKVDASDRFCPFCGKHL